MDNIIHLDEKWYNATKKDMTYYLHPYEDEPHRTVHNKNTIGKVMFLTAVLSLSTTMKVFAHSMAR